MVLAKPPLNRVFYSPRTNTISLKDSKVSSRGGPTVPKDQLRLETPLCGILSVLREGGVENRTVMLEIAA